jgi:anti-sigma factor RsiW
MMNHDLQLKMQAYVDGELAEPGSSEMRDLLSRDGEARALMAELTAMKSALKGLEMPATLPESREFYWSKIERQIRAGERPAQTQPSTSMLDALRRFLFPAGALAAFLLIGLFAASQSGIFGTSHAPEVEATLADSGALTYRDFETRTTLVWLSYPAESEDEDIADLPF